MVFVIDDFLLATTGAGFIVFWHRDHHFFTREVISEGLVSLFAAFVCRNIHHGVAVARGFSGGKVIVLGGAAIEQQPLRVIGVFIEFGALTKAMALQLLQLKHQLVICYFRLLAFFSQVLTLASELFDLALQCFFRWKS